MSRQSIKNWFNKYGAQLNITTFAHYATAAITPASASSLWDFLKHLHDINLLANLVTLSLMYFITIPVFPQVVSNCALTCSIISFLCALLSRYSLGYALTMGSDVILEINATSIYIGLSILRMPPWTRVTSYLTHSLTFLPHPKCGMSNRFNIPEL